MRCSRKLIIIAFIGGLCSISAKGQSGADKWADLLPPAPNASAIVKYGEITLNKNTGVPNISVPLYTLKSKKLATTVSLGYSSTGIRVDEIASRVGMGWALNAGGVITRTVRGTADDLNTRHLPYNTVGMNWSTYNYMKRIGRSISNWGNQGGYDAEPDLFNYNFESQSGKFIIDSNLAIMPIPISSNKFYYNFAGTDWNFKIVTPDGVTYYFGGTGAVEKTKREQICGKLFDTYITTAWYLKKIEHPNGDNIHFIYSSLEYRYDNGVAQTMYWVSPYPTSNNCSAGGPPALSGSTCTNLTVTQGVLLSEIIIENNSKVKFYYTSRTDCEDKLVSRVELVDLLSNNIAGFFTLNYTTVTSNSLYANSYYQGYDKTPYLTSFVESSSDSAFQKVHYFQYNDPAGRPPRLSYSQDHWGYFNGQINTSLVAKPELYLQARFPSATANREPSAAHAGKGMLSKVIYPTGGMDSLIYEGHVAADVKSLLPLYSYTCDVTGTSFHTQVVKNYIFSASGTQNVELNINCIDNTGNGGFDPLHNKGKVEITTLSGTVVFSELFTPGTVVTRYVDVPNGSYYLKLYANGTAVTTRAAIKYYPVTYGSISYNKPVGGVRVKYVLRGNEGEKPTITRYHYAHLSDLNTSSLTFSVPPQYVRLFYHTGFCTSDANQGVYSYEATALQSNSVVSLNDFNYSLISYYGVVESHGENFENGGVYSKFGSVSDSWGTMLMGQQIINAPKANFSSILNGSVLEQTTFKKADANVFVPLRKIINKYKVDSRNARTDYGYYVHDRHGFSPSVPDTTCDISVNPNQFLSCYDWLRNVIGAFDMLKYEIMSRWVYIDTTQEITYDQTGLNPITTTKLFYYDSASHMQLTRTKQFTSKGDTLTERYKYPHDFINSSPYGSMVTKHIINLIVDYKTFENATELSNTKTSYADWGTSNFEPATIESSIKGSALEVDGTVNLYDKSGNVLQHTSRSGLVTSYLWGYRHLYPVAKVIGATYAQVAGTLSVDTAQLQALDGNALKAELHRIRTGLPSALVSSVTYKHLAGPVTIMDANNKTKKFEYDAFLRLRLVRDQDSNIVQKIAYTYTTPSYSANFTPYLNNDTSASTTYQSCQSGFLGSQVTYSVPAGRYFSFVSQADANSKARTDILANLANYASQIGYCDNTLPCTGVNRKTIGCNCELGLKIYTDTYQNSNGTWTCVYHYRFSDNTTTQSYTEISSSACTGNVE